MTTRFSNFHHIILPKTQAMQLQLLYTSGAPKIFSFGFSFAYAQLRFLGFSFGLSFIQESSFIMNMDYLSALLFSVFVTLR